MTLLILGLVLFIGSHLLRVVAEEPRRAWIARYGEGAFKGAYSVVSIIGFALMIWGYSLARMNDAQLWVPPMGLRHANALFTLAAFILMAAAYVPGNAIKTRLRHPMTLSVKVWALGHLLASGTAAGTLLFGSMLVWSVLVFRAARGRDRAAGAAGRPGSAAGALIAAAIGTALWAAFAFWLHEAWLGIAPFK